MIDETLKQIERRVESLDSVPAEKRTELARLLGDLRSEITHLADTRLDSAESITRFADASTHEAVRGGPEKLRQISIDGLAASVEGFEASHPRLVRVVNDVCTALANLGI